MPRALARLNFPYDLPDGVQALERVVVVGEEAWTVAKLKEAKRVEADNLVITWEAGQNSIHDTQLIFRGRDVGNVVVQRRTADGLEDVPYDVSFAFAFSAFVPDGTLHAVLGLSVLHLLEDKEAVIAKVHRMLEPGGVFVTSTACLGDTMKWFKLVGPIGNRLGLIPMVKVFTVKELEESLIAAGFRLDYRWQPAKGVKSNRHYASNRLYFQADRINAS